MPSTYPDHLLIIGAGASYGARKEHRPPLGKDLVKYLKECLSKFSESPKSRPSFNQWPDMPERKIFKETELQKIKKFIDNASEKILITKKQ